MPKKKQKEESIKALFSEIKIITENSDSARELYNLNRLGELKENGNHLSLIEGLYLLEKDKIEIYDGRHTKLTTQKYIKKATRKAKNFLIRYSVFKDLRDRGYVVKTALKFGADFRVYERGVKPGEDHAKWVVYPVHESNTLTWYEFAAKNRVAHSTKKRLLLGVVDDEGDVSYWECRWLRP